MLRILLGGMGAIGTPLWGDELSITSTGLSLLLGGTERLGFTLLDSTLDGSLTILTIGSITYLLFYDLLASHSYVNIYI